MQGRNTVMLPLRRGRQRSAHISTLTILKRFEFQPHLLRSGVSVVDSAGSPDDVLFFIRGAPSSIEQVVGRGRMPDDYHEVSLSYTHACLLPLNKQVQPAFEG